jgi:pimeloyl-ACP methyl ester carboxylesterase
LLLSTSFLIASDFEYSLEYQEAITPFTVIPVFFHDVPENVYAIKAEITLFGNNDNKQFIQSHSAYYPILTNNKEEFFSLIHFMWMIEETQLSVVEEMTQEEKNRFLQTFPKKVEIAIDYDQSLESYYELMKVSFDQEKNKRVIETIWTPENNSPSLENNGNKKAVIFLHGLQNAVYKNILSNLKGNDFDGWRSEELRDYWKMYYQFENTDYFEYHYDTYFYDSKFYGERLTELIEKAGIIDSYDEIYIISYSMGTLVGQYALNSELSYHSGYLGDEVKNLFLIGGVLEGTYFVNLTDYLFEYITREASLKAINTNYNDERDTFLYEVLSMLNNYFELLLNPEKVQYFLDQFVEFYRNNPVLSCLLLTSFDDVPVTGGQIVPYAGVKSMRYTSSEFLTKLEKEFAFNRTTYVINEELNLLNKTHHYKDKIILITSYASNSEEFLKKTSALMKFMNFTPGSENLMSDTQLLNIPFIQYMIQRVLSTIIQNFAAVISESDHTLNDGFVTQWSQNLTPHQEGIRKENLYIFDDLDHAQIKNAPLVLQVIKERID